MKENPQQQGSNEAKEWFNGLTIDERQHLRWIYGTPGEGFLSDDLIKRLWQIKDSPTLNNMNATIEKEEYRLFTDTNPTTVPIIEQQQGSRNELVQDFKELNVYFTDLYRQGVNQVKDAGHLWIAFSDKFNAFERKISRLAALSDAQTDAPNFQFTQWVTNYGYYWDFNNGNIWRKIGNEEIKMSNEELYQLFKQTKNR